MRSSLSLFNDPHVWALILVLALVITTVGYLAWYGHLVVNNWIVNKWRQLRGIK